MLKWSLALKNHGKVQGAYLEILCKQADWFSDICVKFPYVNQAITPNTKEDAHNYFRLAGRVVHHQLFYQIFIVISFDF